MDDHSAGIRGWDAQRSRVQHVAQDTPALALQLLMTPRRAYHRRLGFIRIMKYPMLRRRRLRVGRMWDSPGFYFDTGRTTVQVALHWWGFGTDG